VNSATDLLRVVLKREALSAKPPGRARGRLSALAGPPGLVLAQYCSSVFLFLLSPEPKQL
jgi:hypothetical protein